jgi:hypothetical protein
MVTWGQADHDPESRTDQRQRAREHVEAPQAAILPPPADPVQMGTSGEGAPARGHRLRGRRMDRGRAHPGPGSHLLGYRAAGVPVLPANRATQCSGNPIPEGIGASTSDNIRNTYDDTCHTRGALRHNRSGPVSGSADSGTTEPERPWEPKQSRARLPSPILGFSS